MEEQLDELLETIKTAKCEKKKKWICPICVGEGHLQKEKIIYKKPYKFEGVVGIFVNIIKRELSVKMIEDDEEVYESTIPIRYCPWCGRKVRRRGAKK